MSQKSHFESEIDRVQSNFMELAIESNANSSFEIDRMNDLTDFILYSPKALYNLWIRPVFPKAIGFLELINAAESLFYLLILLLPFLYKHPSPNDDQWMLLSLSICFLLFASILIGNTVPILGAIVRYRSPLIIFYLISLITFVDWNKIKNKVPLK